MQDDVATPAVASAAADTRMAGTRGYLVPAPLHLARDPSAHGPPGADHVCSAHRRYSRRGDFYETIPAISSISSRTTRTRAHRRPRRPRSGCFTTASVYVTSAPGRVSPSRMIANEMRRDSGNIRQGDSVEFAFDTFRDRRNAILFEANALGARTDLQSTNERQMNIDWNPVWTLSAGRFEGGWTIEAAVPFKSIRYAPGSAQDWGFQARRSNKWKNEISYLTKVPPALGLGRADFSASLYANLVGLEAPPLSRNLEIKPYVIADLTTDNVATPATFERSGWRHRRRREVQHHAEPDGRPHLQHRLRAGRGRRAAGEPDALQPVLPREARLLPREPGPLHLRRAPSASGQRWPAPPTCRCSSTAAASVSPATARCPIQPEAG